MRRLLWGSLILFFVLFSLVPSFYEISRQKDLHPERYFELVHNYYTDYNFYLSRIRQGREGAWTVHEKYTSEPHEGSYIQIMYLYMGKLSAWLDVPWPRSGDTYHVARIVLGATLLFLIAYAAKTVFDSLKWQLIAFLLAVTASSWPIFVFHNGEWRLGVYMAWWSLNDILLRITFIPHMIAGQALIVFLLVSLSAASVMHRAGNWIFLGLIALLLGVVFPPGLLFVFAALGVFVLIDFLYQLPFKKRHDLRQWAIERLGGPAMVGVISAPSLLYLSLALKVYPWKRLVDFSILHPQPFVLQDYVLAMGPLLPLGILGALLALLRKEKRFFLFVAWTVAWFCFIIAFQYIPGESPLRFTEMVPHVPLGFLTAYLFYQLYIAVGRLLRLKKVNTELGIVNSEKAKNKSVFSIQNSVFIIPTVIILFGLGEMWSASRWQQEFVDHKIRATMPLVAARNVVMYPLKDMVTTMIWLQDHTKRTDVILSETTAGNYIPVYSGNTVYVGHAGTVNTEQKELVVKDFYSGRMGPEKAKAFLLANNIHYVFYGPQEVEDGGFVDLSTVYPFLRELYHFGYFKVYGWE